MNTLPDQAPPVAKKPVGRPALFTNNKDKQKAYEQRRKVQAEQLGQEELQPRVVLVKRLNRCLLKIEAGERHFIYEAGAILTELKRRYSF